MATGTAMKRHNPKWPKNTRPVELVEDPTKVADAHLYPGEHQLISDESAHTNTRPT